MSMKEDQLNKANEFISSKNGKWLSGEYVNGKSIIEVQCREGHIWTTRFEYIRQEKWCAVCAKKATSLRVRKAGHLRRINKRIEYVKSPQYNRDKVNKQIWQARMRRYKTDSFKEARDIRRKEKADIYAKNYYSKNKDKIAKQYSDRYHNDMVFQLNERLKGQLRKCLIKDRVMGKYYELLGYSTDRLKDHLESLFVDGMSWENVSEWHIDHVRPKSWYVLTHDDGTVNEDEVRKCWALSNLQPLWASDNIAKRDRWEG